MKKLTLFSIFLVALVILIAGSIFVHSPPMVTDAMAATNDAGITIKTAAVMNLDVTAGSVGFDGRAAFAKNGAAGSADDSIFAVIFEQKGKTSGATMTLSALRDSGLDVLYKALTAPANAMGQGVMSEAKVLIVMQTEDLSGNKTAVILQATSHVPKIYSISACKDHGTFAGESLLEATSGLRGGLAYATSIKPGLNHALAIYAYGISLRQPATPMRV